MNPSALFDLPSLLFVLGSAFAMLVAGRFSTYSIKIIDHSIMQVGVTGTLIGVVIILQNMSDPNAIGPAMAVALLVPLYCLIIKGITFNLAKVMNIPATEPSTSMSWLGILILTIVLISPMATSVGLAAFIDLTSIVIILIAISIVVAISYINNKEHVLDNIAKTLPLIGFVGFFIGLIGMLQNINDPKSIGPAMAVALLTLQYTMILLTTCNLIKPQLCEGEENKSLAYAGTSILLVILAFAILMLSFV
jgi:flagellar motor component MotA